MIKNWPLIPLDNLVTKVGSGSTPKGGETVYKSEGVPFIRSMNVVFFGFKHTGLAFLDNKQADGLKNAEVKALDILLNITGASIGRVTLAPKSLEGARVNQHVCIIRPNEALEPRFLNAYFSSPAMQSRIWADNYGVTRQALTKQQILDFEIPLAPLPEQKRIADKLDATLARVDVCRERLARVAPILKRFRQSVLAAAVSGRLTADWRAQQAGGDNIPLTTESPDQPAVIEPASGNQAQTRSPDAAQRNPGSNAPHSPGVITDENLVANCLNAAQIIDHIGKAQKTAKIRLRGGVILPSMEDIPDEIELPSGWAVTGFDTIAAAEANALKAGPFGSALKKNMYVTSGYKIYGQEQVIAGSETIGDYFIDEIKFKELESCAVKPGDILISLVGTIGRVLILSENCCPGIINPRLVKLSLHHLISRSFISLYLCSPLAQKFFAKQSHGGTMDILNLGILRELPILLPSCKEQHEIVRRVESLFAFADRLEARLAAAQTAAEQLTPALLAKAFRGELVPQDPADEPASELLQRLAASRASAAKPKRSRTPRQPA